MADFLEERLASGIKIGASFNDSYEVNIVTTSGGNEYRSLIHPFPARTFDVSFMLEKQDTYDTLLSMWHRAHGKFAGFRIRCFDEWSSNGSIGTPTAFDQSMLLVSSGVYQLRKIYGTNGTAGATGYPYRLIKKPVSGTVRVAIGVTEIRSADWLVSTTTGLVTFASDVSHAITGISKAAQAVVTLGAHSYVVGQSVGFINVAGMTNINGMRGLITAADATTITVNINSSAFGTYSAGGEVHTRPQTGETVTAGFQFDFPVRFNSSLPIGQDYTNHRSIDGVELIEILNP